MIKALFLAASLFAASVQAATPQRMSLVYDLYRNGQKLGQVADTLTRSGSRYILTSETRAKGALQVLWPGTIRLESTGTVMRQGLRPEKFEHARSDAPHKLATARLDWKQRAIAYRYNGESRQVNGLRPGAQDQLSQIYQFMFAPRVAADYRLQVVSGRDINEYRYARKAGETIETPLGTLSTRQYQRITQNPDEKAVSIWVAPARRNLPVRVRVSEDGVTLEQRLVSARVEG